MEHEAFIRTGIFLFLFVLISAVEVIAPRRRPTVPKRGRWVNNIGMMLLTTGLIRLIVPITAVAAALFANEHGWGLFHHVQVPTVLAVVGSVIALDLIIYLQHILVHAVPILWRIHRVHHADPEYDVTTGIRFHPIEIVLSLAIKLIAVVLLGAPASAVVLFEAILNGMAMFNHGNIRLPVSWDRILRGVLVTPDMHRVHHSPETDELNANFGFNISLWDKMFGTYRAQPRMGHENMRIGIEGFHARKDVISLLGMLALPFRKKAPATVK